ncbi:purple acid phosphatase family protein [Alienimonas chondri]|uniref:3',5'-cyclic adenosine monophosphate phosphodiesterase CpdA n=1 Tax=Alienimonas chondri TaxID=2681879 RepID=A0ABX1VF79_9PLAN|nr:metallophosphoesterase family protein [Alienimonas chondri]NNJ26729.1 3',5'-cyclic adenosine monophosphate phosphodiesterase CpdA [Alienimonas chondri]
MLHRPALTVLAALAAPAVLFAHPPGGDGHHVHLEDLPQPEKQSDAVTHAPTAMPDRVVLTYAHDPAATQAVTWRTHDETENAFAQIALATRGPQFVSPRNRMSADEDFVTVVSAETTPYRTELSAANYHTAEFTGLTPSTKYVYRVGDGTNWSEWSHFTTAADKPEPFSFIYVGDAQNEVFSLWSRVIRQAFADAPKAAFTLHAGDLINKAEADDEWGGWFDAGGFINRGTPVLATPGNHEYYTKGKVVSAHWRPTFAFPENGPDIPGLEETVWYLDYQGVRFISLNSNEKTEEQVPWLRKTLASNPHRWTIVTFHHPLYNSKAGRDNPELRAAWQPLFDEFGVDLVLQGHDHTYARSKLVTAADNEVDRNASPSEDSDVRSQPADGVTRDENVAAGVSGVSEAGTVYVVSVSGPKMYDLGDRPLFRRTGGGTQLYQIISLDGDVLRFDAYTATGALFDGFTLTKNESGPNTLTEDAADDVQVPVNAETP